MFIIETGNVDKCFLPFVFMLQFYCNFTRQVPGALPQILGSPRYTVPSWAPIFGAATQIALVIFVRIIISQFHAHTRFINTHLPPSSPMYSSIWRTPHFYRRHISKLSHFNPSNFSYYNSHQCMSSHTRCICGTRAPRPHFRPVTACVLQISTVIGG